MRKSAQIMILLAFILGICLPGEANPAAKKGKSLSAYKGYQSIKEAKFRKIFKEYLYQRLEKEPSDVMVSRLKVLGNRPVPPGKISFQIFQKDKRRLRGQVNLVAIVMSNGVVKNRVRLSGWVDVFESVILTSRNLKKREIIKKEDIYLVRKNISHLSPNILTDMSRAIGLMAKHNLKEGAILKEWMLEKSPIVKRGDMVTILAESGHLRVTVPGRVLEKGYLGEIIRVQNTMSKKKIHARVINNSTVMVYF